MKQRFTKEKAKIAAEIRSLYQRGEPLNLTAMKRQQPRLIKAVYGIRPFWGWKQALETAGIDYKKISIQLCDYVTCHICGRKMRHLCSHLPRVHGVSSEEYKIDYPDEGIFCESTLALFCRRSRKHQKHCRLRHWEPLWTPEYALDRLAELHRKGRPMHLNAVHEVDATLIQQCFNYFGAYDESIRRIGLNPTEIRRHTNGIAPPKQEVVDFIRKRHAQGKSLSLTQTLREEGRMPGFYSAILRHFGSWRNAVETAGYDYVNLVKRAQKYRAKHELITAICDRHQKKRPLNWRGLHAGTDADQTLYRTGARLFGTWEKAIRAAGLSFKSISISRMKYPDKQAVIKAIRQRAQQGLPVLSSRGPMTERALNRAIYRFFRSYPLARKAAGVPHGYRARKAK
ncbi:MAG: hypothetical protein HYV36_01935 [Lentisphaerae bacterium]|nr:hypothetical protein [Lentisphaerota bacterium]